MYPGTLCTSTTYTTTYGMGPGTHYNVIKYTNIACSTKYDKEACTKYGMGPGTHYTGTKYDMEACTLYTGIRYTGIRYTSTAA